MNITSKSIQGRNGHWYTLVRSNRGWRLKSRSEAGDMHYAGGDRWTRRGTWFAKATTALAQLNPDVASALLMSIAAREGNG